MSRSTSQFPENVQRDLLESLRTRRVNHKFHYDSVKQTQKWLALHQAYSPTRNDVDCRSITRIVLAAAAEKIKIKIKFTSSASAAAADKRTRVAEIVEELAARKFFTRRAMSARQWFWSRAKPRSQFCRKKVVFRSCAIWRRRILQGFFVTMEINPMHAAVTFFGMIPNFEPRKFCRSSHRWFVRRIFCCSARILRPATITPPE
jgi:L-histidine N-alpha-methyltransferase